MVVVLIACFMSFVVVHNFYLLVVVSVSVVFCCFGLMVVLFMGWWF